MFILQLGPNILSPKFNPQRPLHLSQDLLIWNGLSVLIVVDDRRLLVDLLCQLGLFPGRCFLGASLGDGFADGEVDFGGRCYFVFAVDFG